VLRFFTFSALKRQWFTRIAVLAEKSITHHGGEPALVLHKFPFSLTQLWIIAQIRRKVKD
jgi:hypothetical protein